MVLPPWFGPETTKMREREIECAPGANRLRCRQRGVAETQASVLERPDVFEIGDVELDLAIPATDHRIQVGLVVAEIFVEASEYVGVQRRDEVENARLDMVHLEEVGELEIVVLDVSLL